MRRFANGGGGVASSALVIATPACNSVPVERQGPWLVHRGDSFRLAVLVGQDPLGGNVDIEIAMTEDGSRWSGTVHTPGDLDRLLERWGSTGGGAASLYIWEEDMIVVRTLSEDVIVRVAEDLVRTGEYRKALRSMPSLSE